MRKLIDTQHNNSPARIIRKDKDIFGEHRSLGISSIAFKETSEDKNGIFIIENTFYEKGGPARHLHFNQDEWFYAIQGEFLFEVGQDKYRLKPGDALLAPRKVAHVWAYAGGSGSKGKIIIAFMPAGKMESFFREVTKANAMPPQDPELWRAHDMELLGPPLIVE